MLPPKSSVLVIAAALLAGCGGTVVVHGDTGGAGGDPGETTSTGDLPPGGCENRVDYEGVWSPIHAVFQYDATGHLVHYAETRDDGAVRFAMTRTYDEEGRRVAQDEEDYLFDPGGSRSLAWEYDDEDRVVRATAEGFDGGPWEMKLFYGPDGRREHVETYSNDALFSASWYSWTDGDPLVVEVTSDYDADGQEDSKDRWYFAGGRWLVQHDMLSDGVLDVTENYSYSEGPPGLLTHEASHWPGSPAMDSFASWTYDASKRLVHEEFSIEPTGTSTFDFTYDAAGRPLVKTFTPADLPGQTLLTLYTWGKDGLDRVERRAADPDQFIEGWTFTRGCPEDRPMDVPIAPVVSWTYELPGPEYTVDLERFWGFPDGI